MQDLFIQIRDGQPFEHPIFGDNFRAAFPDVNIEELPTDRFARFQRIERPIVETFQVVEGPVYALVDGIVKDVWAVRPMTPEEEIAKRQSLADAAIASVGFCKSLAQQNADEAKSQEAKQTWLDYKAELEAWVLLDPVEPNIPAPPRLNPDGTLYVPPDLSAPGSAPNVDG